MNVQEQASGRNLPTAEAVCSARPNSFPDRNLSEGSPKEPKDDLLRRDLRNAAPGDGTGVTGCVTPPVRHGRDESARN
jgi:hypothetical protein